MKAETTEFPDVLEGGDGTEKFWPEELAINLDKEGSGWSGCRTADSVRHTKF